MTGPTAAIQALSFAPDSKTLFSGGLDRVVRQWEVAVTPAHERRKAPNASPIVGFLDHVALSADNQFLATHTKSDMLLQLWELNGPAPDRAKR